MHKLNDVPLERLVVEHYLFDLGQPVEKTAEILDMDEEKVRRIHQESSGFYPTVRKDR
ncbi:MAG: hypothetical protein [Namikivirus tsukuho]|uniref:RNA polymerase sigma-70 region 4 domain-containing protein n=1 Tax=Bacteriophage sp. TaxID=38018 RepID=A0ABY5TRU5_9VIRU|nr:MAG: hypothetical protein [Bacteriophage sp.]